MDRRPAGFPTPAATGIEHDAIRLIIATRVALYREGLAEALHAKSRIAVVGTAAGSRELVAAVRDVATDAVLLDTELDDAVVTAGQLVARRPDLKFVALLVAEVARKPIAPGQITFAPPGAAGKTLEIQSTFVAADFDQSKPLPLLREFGLFSSGTPNLLMNHRVHPPIGMQPGFTLQRTLRLTF